MSDVISQGRFWMKKAPTAAVVLTAALVFPAVALSEGNLLVTPIEILQEQPDCNAENEVAYRISFDAKDISAHIGDPESLQPQICTIRTRRGGQATEIRIPCPETEGNEVTSPALSDVVALVEFSGSIVGCRSFGDHSILSADWQLSGQTPSGAVAASGDLTNAYLHVFFDAPALQVPPSNRDAVSNQAVWAIAFEALPLEGATGGNDNLSLTTYVGLSESAPLWGFCVQEDDGLRTCDSRSADGMALSSLAGSRLLNDIVRYVHEGKRP